MPSLTCGKQFITKVVTCLGISNWRYCLSLPFVEQMKLSNLCVLRIASEVATPISGYVLGLGLGDCPGGQVRLVIA